MGKGMEDLHVLQTAEDVADQIWGIAEGWNDFARKTVGGQLVRASDSIGANIAEAFGRYHYGEKINHLYYARGSLFETKYWLNRAVARSLLNADEHKRLADLLTPLAKQINQYVQSLKAQRGQGKAPDPNALHENRPPYLLGDSTSEEPLFAEVDLAWPQQSPSRNS